MKNVRFYFNYLATFGLGLLFVLVFPHSSLASEDLMVDNIGTTYSVQFVPNGLCQSFIATKNNLTSIHLEARKQTTSQNANIIIYDGTSFSDVVGTSSTVFIDSGTKYEYAFDFSLLALTPYSEYSFCFYSPSTQVGPYYRVDTYADGESYFPGVGWDSGYDLSFSIYYDVEQNLLFESSIFDFEENGYVTEQAYQISFPEYQYCIINETCTWDIFYTEDAIGYQISLVAYRLSDDIWQIDEVQASSTITLDNLINFREGISPDTETDGTSTKYYYLYEGPDGDVLFGPTRVEWVTQAEIEDAYADVCEDYDSSTVCDGISTSTEEDLWDDFNFGVECGLRKFSYWLMTPSYVSCVQFQNHMEDLKSNFPFSIITQAKNLFTEISQSTSTATQVMPLYYQGPGSTSPIVSIGDLIDDSQFQAGAFYPIWQDFYALLESLLWAMLVGYVIFRFII